MKKAKVTLSNLRKDRVRLRLQSRSDLPRLVVTRSNRHFYAQIIDRNGKVLSSASSNSSDSSKSSNKTHAAALVGQKLAESAQKADVKAVVLDRGQYRYHGRVRAFTEAVREKGIKV